MQEILRTFDVCGMNYEILEIGEGWHIIISQHGGHVFGPFSERYREGLFWIPESVKQPEAYRKLIEARTWNIGGERGRVPPSIPL